MVHGYGSRIPCAFHTHYSKLLPWFVPVLRLAFKNPATADSSLTCKTKKGKYERWVKNLCRGYGNKSHSIYKTISNDIQIFVGLLVTRKQLNMFVLSSDQGSIASFLRRLPFYWIQNGCLLHLRTEMLVCSTFSMLTLQTFTYSNLRPQII